MAIDYGSAYLPAYLLKKSKCIKTSLNIGDKDETFHLARPDLIGERFSFFFLFLFSFSFFSFSESVESVSSSARV